MKNNLLTLFFAGSFSLAFGQTTFTTQVNSSLDDHEEHINGSVPQTQTLGSMDPASSDLELGNEKAAADPQLIGIRFTSLTIPANAVITNAYIQFKVDDVAKNTDPCELSIQAEDAVNPATFSDNAFSLSTRSVMGASVNWTVSGSTWSVVGSMGPDQRTPNLASLVQAIVNKPNWVSGNAMAFFIKGKGTREVESFDGGDPNPPMLLVQYSVSATGVREFSNHSSVSVYPNPFKNTFNVRVENVSSSNLSVSVYDITGKLVEELANNVFISGTTTFTSAAEMAPGMYFVKIKLGEEQKVLRLISE